MTSDPDIKKLDHGASDPGRYHRGDATVLDRIQDSKVRRFTDYWIGLRRGRRMPARADLDPVDVPWALSRIFVGDYDPATKDFIYRVSGEEVAEVFRRFNGRASMRGVRLGDGMPAPSVAAIRRRWDPVGERGDILYMAGTVYQAADRLGIGERIVMPLSDDGTTVTGFCGYTICRWHDRLEWEASPEVDVWHIPCDAIPTTE